MSNERADRLRQSLPFINAVLLLLISISGVWHHLFGHLTGKSERDVLRCQEDPLDDDQKNRHKNEPCTQDAAIEEVGGPKHRYWRCKDHSGRRLEEL